MCPNPLSGCVITWRGRLHMDNLAVLWDKILMFNLKNQGFCWGDYQHQASEKHTTQTDRSSAFSFVAQMLEAIWLADSSACNQS